MSTHSKCQHCPCPSECGGYPYSVEWEPGASRPNRNASNLCIRDTPRQRFRKTAIPLLHAKPGTSSVRSRFARSGFKLTPKWLRKARLAKCEEPCEKWDPRQRRCMSCGCKEDVKVHILAAECPLKKWPVPTEDELTMGAKGPA